MADYLTDLKKKLSDALRDVAAKVKASPTGAAKSGAPTQSGPPVNITINVQPPKESEDAAKTQDERVENVYLEREAAKAGFYGGSSYAKQVAARFRAVGYATPVGGLLAKGEHYLSIVEHANKGTRLGSLAGGAADGLGMASITVALIAQVLPIIKEMIDKFAKEGATAAKALSAVGAGATAAGVGTAIVPGIGTAIGGIGGAIYGWNNPLGQNDFGPAIQRVIDGLDSANQKIVQITAGMEAVKSAAMLALSLGDKTPSLQNADGFFGAGDYAGFHAAIKNMYERKVKEKIGGGIYDMARVGVTEIIKAIEGSFK